MFERVLAIAILAAASASAQSSGKVLAVLEFQSKLEGAEKKAVDAGYLADTVRSAVLETVPGMKVMTRENVLVLLQSSGKKLEDCQGECEVDTGRRLGADLVISGELLKFGTNYKLTLKLHDTHDGQLLSGSQASGRTVDELDAETSKAVHKLLAPLAPQTTATREAPVARAAPGGARLTIGTEGGSQSFAVSIEARGQTFNCANIVSDGHPCTLDGMPVGTATVVLSGDANDRHDTLLSTDNRRLVLQPRGRFPVYFGGTLTGIGVVGGVIGAAATGGFYGGSGFAAAVGTIATLGTGLGFLIYGLARSPVDYAERPPGAVSLVPFHGGLTGSLALRF